MYFGEYLINTGKITHDQLHEGLKAQSDSKLPIGEVMINLGYLQREDLDLHLQEHMANCAEILVADEN